MAPTLSFKTTPYKIKQATIARLPEKASKELSSRGQVSVKGMVNGKDFQMVLEPDGNWGHWFRVDPKFGKAGDTLDVKIAQIKEWPEPNIPADLAKALKAAPANIQKLWHDITPMARWEWVRWVNATSVDETRARRVEVSISKMKSGKRRPCCFNLAGCTDASLTKNGRLMDAA